jgi:hypothetical protein
LSDEAAIEAVLRAFLNAAAEGSDIEQFVTGPVRHTLLRPASLRTVGWKTARSSVKVKRLEVEPVHGDTATVALDAHCFAALKEPILGEQQVTMRMQGPARLVREGAEWKIVTLTCDRLDWLSALYSPTPAVASLGPFRISAAAWLRRTGIGVLVVINNDSNDPGDVQRVQTNSRVWWFFRDGTLLLPEPTRIEAGGKWTASVNPKGSPLRREIDVDVQSEVGTRRLSLASPARLPLGKRLRNGFHPLTVLHFILGGLAVFGLVSGDWLGFWVTLFILGLLNLTGEVGSVLSGVRVSAQFLYLSVGLAETLAALFFLARSDVHWWTLAAVLAPILVYMVLQVRATLHTHRARGPRRRA